MPWTRGKPIEKQTEQTLPSALRVHDKFHISAYPNKAVDAARKQENRAFLKNDLKHPVGTKYLWLKGEWSKENKALYQTLKGVCAKTSRAWSIKEAFGCFRDYVYKGVALNYFNRWYYWATHSGLKPIIDAAKMLKRHLDELLNYFKHRITNANAESVNSKIQQIKYNARGFRSFKNFRASILFYCGKLDLFP